MIWLNLVEVQGYMVYTWPQQEGNPPKKCLIVGGESNQAPCSYMCEWIGQQQPNSGNKKNCICLSLPI